MIILLRVAIVLALILAALLACGVFLVIFACLSSPGDPFGDDPECRESGVERLAQGNP